MRKVLIVDDSPEVLRMLQRTWAPLDGDWEVAFADSGERALTLLERAPCDVLATDMVMPGMDGLQLLQAAKSRYPEMVRIAFSRRIVTTSARPGTHTAWPNFADSAGSPCARSCRRWRAWPTWPGGLRRCDETERSGRT